MKLLLAAAILAAGAWFFMARARRRSVFPPQYVQAIKVNESRAKASADSVDQLIRKSATRQVRPAPAPPKP